MRMVGDVAREMCSVLGYWTVIKSRMLNAV
jgi:hypothetical protein